MALARKPRLLQAQERSEQQGDSFANEKVAGELLGGTTSFLPVNRGERQALPVFPKTGSILAFQHLGLLHSRDPVLRGTKYTMRTDIMYKEKKATPSNKLTEINKFDGDSER
jgi:hypothetical protein